METTCKNCDTDFAGNYCGNCGQSADTHAINYHYLWHDIQHGVFHFDKGLFYTIKQLYTRPGAAIKEFIEGRRVKHFKPIAMVFLIGTLYGLFYHYLGLNLIEVSAEGGTEKSKELLDAVNKWMASHYALTTLASIPLFAISTFLVFRKKRYNLIEHAVLNCFVASQKLVLQFAFLPLFYFYSETNLMRIVMAFSIIADFLLTFWTFSTFFTEYSKLSCFIRTLFSYVMYFVFMIIIIAVFIAVWLANGNA